MSAPAALAPRLRATAGPLRAPVDRTVAPNSRAMDADASLELSSTTMHSKGCSVERLRCSRHARRCSAALWTGTMTESVTGIKGLHSVCHTALRALHRL